MLSMSAHMPWQLTAETLNFESGQPTVVLRPVTAGGLPNVIVPVAPEARESAAPAVEFWNIVLPTVVAVIVKLDSVYFPTFVIVT